MNPEPQVPIALIKTPAEAASPWTRGKCVAWSTCLATILRRYQVILLGEQRQTCVNNLTRVVTWSGVVGLEPATSRLQVGRPDHYATMPYQCDK